MAPTSTQSTPSPRLDTSAEALDLVSDLVDASLVDITETPDGEPRIRLLETIRALRQASSSPPHLRRVRAHSPAVTPTTTKISRLCI